MEKIDRRESRSVEGVLTGKQKQGSKKEQEARRHGGRRGGRRHRRCRDKERLDKPRPLAPLYVHHHSFLFVQGLSPSGWCCHLFHVVKLAGEQQQGGPFLPFPATWKDEVGRGPSGIPFSIPLSFLPNRFLDFRKDPGGRRLAVVFCFHIGLLLYFPSFDLALLFHREESWTSLNFYCRLIKEGVEGV